MSIVIAYVYVRLYIHDVHFVEHTVPRDEQEGATLPDGSVIILNLGFVFSHPMRFIGNTHSVYLPDEEYSEAVPDKRLPLAVEINYLGVCVPGTQSNVQMYPLDKRTAATLEAGPVAARKKNRTDCFVILEPNR